MALHNPVFLLGYIDEAITSKNALSLNYTVNKVGGIPNWCISGSSAPTCKQCHLKKTLVMQIYAPLDGSLYHRTLYLFACLNTDCSKSAVGWTCLRSQLLALEYKNSSSTNQTTLYSGDTWFEDEDDWGVDLNDGNGNTDNYNYLPTNNSCANNSKDNLNVNVNSMNANETALTEVTRGLEKKLNLNQFQEDANANESAVCGAVGNILTPEESENASAFIEGPEEDIITLDSPEQIFVDIPSLFMNAPKLNLKKEVELCSFYLSSDIEPVEDTSLSNHERELLLQYSHHSNSVKEEDAAGRDGVGDGFYERTHTHHGDPFIHKFKKRIQRSPEQVLRYCREEGAAPLWLKPPSPKDIPTKCAYCGGCMTYECQIMPQLIPFLKVSGLQQHNVLEFGTVFLFTCLNSCWVEEDVVRQECVVYQGEVL